MEQNAAVVRLRQAVARVRELAVPAQSSSAALAPAPAQVPDSHPPAAPVSAASDDGGLRALFRSRIVSAQWTTVETGAVSRGVPDAEFCFDGAVQGWIEYKATRAGSPHGVRVRPEQIAWLSRRARYGGRCWIAVRRQGTAKGGERYDELHLFPGGAAAEVAALGTRCDRAVQVWHGGPTRWDWAEIEERIRS